MQLVALRVADDHLEPVYHRGELLLHRPLCRDRFDAFAVDGLECVVELASGERLLRWGRVQDNGLFMLLGYSGPPAFDVELVAAAPIEVVLRGQHPRHRREVHPLSLSTNP